ncbi:MAG: carboxypeptidase regulatory-like domain-containing protein [Bdellovibrionota bacterium]
MSFRLKREKLFALALVMGMVLAAAPAARAETEVLTGSHRVVYDIINPLGVERIVNYKNNGYEIRVLEEPDEYSKRVLVEVQMTPLGSKEPYPIKAGRLPPDYKSKFLGPEKMIQVGHPDITALARKLSAGKPTVAEVYEAIANHLRDYITYDASPQVQQDALNVLRTARGSCVGFTTLSIALLRSAGIPARYAHGYLPPGYEWGITQDYWGVKTSGGGYHAWLELYYPDAGWTFSDGEYSKNFVDPYHILRYTDGIIDPPPRGDATLDVDKGTTFTLFEETNVSHPIDGYAEPQKTILGRQIGAQRAAVVYGKVLDEEGKPIEKGEVIRWEGKRGTVTSFNRASYAVVGLSAGPRKITIKAPGYVPENLELTLAERQALEKDVRLAREGAVRGKVTDETGKPVESGEVIWWQGDRGTPQPFEKGSFEFLGLPAGEHRFTIRSQGFVEESFTVKLAARQTADREIKLRRGFSIRGKILNDMAAGVRDQARILLSKDQKSLVYELAEDRSFLIEGIDPGDYEVSVEIKGFENRDIAVKAIPGETRQLDLKLEPAGWIEGKVVDGKGMPLGGAAVYIKKGNSWVGTPAREDGTFVLYGIASGKHQLKARHKQLGEQKAEAEVLGPQATQLIIRYP